MNIGQLVRIGGRTRLSPTFSLVGLTGIVVPTAPGAPSGCVTVWVNWQEAGYENLDELPPAVNVPEIHLEPLTAEEAKAKEKPAPHLQSVARTNSTASTRAAHAGKNTSTQENAAAQNDAATQPKIARDESATRDDEEDEPRPKLRLV